MDLRLAVNPWGFTGLFAVLSAWGLAAFLRRAAIQDAQVRLFSAVLVVEGLVLVTASAGLVMLLRIEPTPNYYWAHHIADCVMLALYPLFLAYALPQPFLAGLRTRKAAFALSAIALAVILLRAFTDFWLIALLVGVMFIGAFMLAVLAISEAKTPLARRRAQLFAVAFGIRDLAWGFTYLTGFFGLLRPGGDFVMWGQQIYAGSTLVYVPLVAYGILSARLLDIQVQVKRGVQRGTLAAGFVGIYFLVSEGAASLLSDQFGSVLGLLGATVVVILLTPLHRLTNWLSGQIVEVDESAEYRAYRKLQLYATAYEDALKMGEVTPSQRMLLDRLRESLGLSDADASHIEVDLTAQIQPV